MEHSVCFIGHRTIADTPALRERLQKVLVKLIEGGTANFIFGDHSAFNDLCYETVTQLKEKHPAVYSSLYFPVFLFIFRNFLFQKLFYLFVCRTAF